MTSFCVWFYESFVNYVLQIVAVSVCARLIVVHQRECLVWNLCECICLYTKSMPYAHSILLSVCVCQWNSVCVVFVCLIR